MIQVENEFYNFDELAITVTISYVVDNDKQTANQSAKWHITKTKAPIVLTKEQQIRIAKEYYTKAVPYIYQRLANKLNSMIVYTCQHPDYVSTSKTYEPFKN